MKGRAAHFCQVTNSACDTNRSLIQAVGWLYIALAFTQLPLCGMKLASLLSTLAEKSFLPNLCTNIKTLLLPHTHLLFSTALLTSTTPKTRLRLPCPVLSLPLANTISVFVGCPCGVLSPHLCALQTHYQSSQDYYYFLLIY